MVIESCKPLALLLPIVLFVASATSAQSEGATFEFDPGTTVTLNLTKKVSLHFYTGREKTEELSDYKWKYGGGVNFRMKPFFTPFSDDPDADKRHLLVVGASYEFSRTSNAGSVSTENRITLDATPRYQLPKKLLLTDRNRFEFRWVNGDYRFRYRNRFKMERGFRIDKFRMTPYAYVEAYWDQHYDRWSQFRFAVGSEFPIRKHTSIDVYYERLHCVTCADSQTNILGVTLNLYFKLKEK